MDNTLHMGTCLVVLEVVSRMDCTAVEVVLAVVAVQMSVEVAEELLTRGQVLELDKS